VLPAGLRLRRSSDFDATVRRGARAGRRTLVVHCRAVPTDATRVGLVVSRAVGGAVVRNKVRRRLRGVVVEQRTELPAGADVVVRALPPAAEAGYADLAADFRSALRSAASRAGLLPGDRVSAGEAPR
jgi:ribonuclease P protein component